MTNALRTKAATSRSTRTPVPEARASRNVPPSVHDALLSPGQPLDTQTRVFMEQRFGHDFGRVRIHADPKAAASAGDVNALAYAVGRDVVFGPGQYAPAIAQGRRLLAHELSHVVQQGDALVNPFRSELSNPTDSAEQDAERAALAVVAGEPLPRLDSVGSGVHRDVGWAQRGRDPYGGLESPQDDPQVAAELAAPSPTATVILVGSPTRAGEWDKYPYNYSDAAVKILPKLNADLPGTAATILYFSPGYKMRGQDVYEKAWKDLNGTGATVVEVTDSSQIISFLNTGLVASAENTPTRALKISRFVYFGHGTSGELLLDWGWTAASSTLATEQITKIKTDAFVPTGKSYLFTCHIAHGDKSFMSVWASHLGQTSVGPQDSAAFNASYSAADLEKALNKELPKWFLGLPYMNQVRIIPGT